MGYKSRVPLSATHPELTSQWHPNKNGDLSPDQITPGSGKKVWWVCAKNHTWEATVNDRTARGRGCPYCANKRTLAGYNDLATTAPNIAALWHPTLNGELTPRDVTRMSNKKVWWQCSTHERHHWIDSVDHLSAGRRCPMCSRHQVDIGYNDLASRFPDIAAEWHLHLNHSISPTTVSYSSNKVVWWQCSRNSAHIWRSSVNNRTTGKGKGCPICAGTMVLQGFNDLATTHPDIAAQWHPTLNGSLAPTEVSFGSEKRIWWVCPSNAEHVWQTFVYARRSAETGCPRCSIVQLTSRAENDLLALLTKFGLTAQQSVRNLLGSRHELDLYIPSKNFAIEFNGLYWHSEDMGKGPDYHQYKTDACAQRGIRLFHVWEDDWRDRQEIVIRSLAHRLEVTDRLKDLLPDLPDYYHQQIGARQTSVYGLDYAATATFLDKHHIQGSVKGSHYFGLRDTQERLRAVLVLSKTGKSGELRIDRYATAGTVSGGFTKLLTHAEKIYKPSRWVTFADLSISDGGLYEKAGFTAEDVLPPDYSYLVNNTRVHKFNYRLKRFREDPSLQYEEGLTERQLAILNGLPRIWDSGKVRYIKDVN